jgi:hypothetical protein
MYQFHRGTLPLIFSDFFKKVVNVHNYNTRLSSELSYALPKIRTSYGDKVFALSPTFAISNLNSSLLLSNACPNTLWHFDSHPVTPRDSFAYN